MKEDEMMTAARSAADRNMRRKHSEMGEIQGKQCLKKIRRTVGKPTAEISNEHDGKGDEADK